MGAGCCKRFDALRFPPCAGAETMRLTRSDKTNVIVVVAIAVGACLGWWFLMR
jgi:hypothetical protein